MSAAVMGHYSSESPRDMSPDPLSPIYPDRPIRPLPKRRLRERLSPNVAESIKYPPAPPTTTPLFYYPYSLASEDDRIRDGKYTIERRQAEQVEQNYISRRNNANVQEVDSEEDYTELAYRSRYSRHSPDVSGRSYRYVQKPESSKYSKPDPPASTTSSADGYDSFENTNNKKKRKIPTPGDAGLNGIHLSNDLASLGISAADDAMGRDEASNGVGQYYGSGGSAMNVNGQGLSGPGRGRYGRVRNGRSPLRTLSDASSNWSNGRTPKQRQPQWPANESPGIISTAIANAEKLPLTPSRGQENISLLQQQASKKSSPASTQFTFTCDSQVPGAVAWPLANSLTGFNQSNSYNRSPHSSTQATQTSPKALMDGSLSRGGSRPIDTGARPKGQKQNAPPKRTRRRAERDYAIAERQRRERRQYQNYHHPPPEDMWMCEFCEYEQIFGSRPEALIRQYEIKDRRIKKQEAERRRLLEKARMKGRKGKKGGKLAPKNPAPVQDRHAQDHAVHQPAMNNSQSQSQGTQSEEYYEDEYDEEYGHEEPPPSPTLAANIAPLKHEVASLKHEVEVLESYKVNLDKPAEGA